MKKIKKKKIKKHWYEDLKRSKIEEKGVYKKVSLFKKKKKKNGHFFVHPKTKKNDSKKTKKIYKVLD